MTMTSGRMVKRGRSGLVVGLLSGLLLVGAAASPASAQDAAATKVIKLATVMPTGSPWTSGLQRFAANVRKRTGGKVIVRLYSDGVAGDELRAIHRMQRGQIQGVAATLSGLSAIESSIRVLELPLLYRSYKEFRFALHSMEPVFQQRLVAKGYRALAFVGVGWVYLFSKRAVSTLAQLRQHRVWYWKQDPLAPELLSFLGVRGVRLPLPAVFTALQTNSIDAVYGMAHSTQALQWHGHLNHVLQFRVSMATAGLVLRNDAFDGLAAEHKKILLEEAQTLQGVLNRSNLAINERAMRTMVRGGMTVNQPSAGFRSHIKSIRPKVWGKLSGRFYLPADLRKIKALIAVCRATGCSI